MFNGDFQRSPAWSIPVTVRVKRTWMTWGWSEAQQANVTKRQRHNKDESWIKSFSLSLFTLNHKKFSQKGFIFCFCSVPFLFHFFSFNIFPLFYHHFFFVHFSPSSFCSSLFDCLPFFFSLFSPFFISVCVSLSLLWQRTTHVHPEKWVKAVVCEWSTNVWKGGLLLAFFWAWLKVLVDGPESTKESALADVFLARFGSKCVSCDWVTCVWHRQPAGHALVNAYHHLPLFFSLSTLILLITRGKNSYWKDWANLRRWSWNLEDSMVCVEDQKKIELEKQKICGRATQRLGRGNKQTGR